MMLNDYDSATIKSIVANLEKRMAEANQLLEKSDDELEKAYYEGAVITYEKSIEIINSFISSDLKE